MKWQYCILRQYSDNEFWLYKSTGEKEKLKGQGISLASVLSHLGDEGWEAVNYIHKGKETGWGDISFKTWPVSVSDREFLFKRSSS